MIIGADSRKPWDAMDRQIMLAYQIHLDERCQSCGLPIWLCHSEDNRLDIKINVDHCAVKEELEAYEDRNKESDPAEKWGKTVVPSMATRNTDLPLHKFRRVYYDALRAEAEESAALEAD